MFVCVFSLRIFQTIEKRSIYEVIQKRLFVLGEGKGKQKHNRHGFTHTHKNNIDKNTFQTLTTKIGNLPREGIDTS